MTMQDLFKAAALDSWSNNAAQGYAAQAARNIGLTADQIEQLTDEMGVLFDSIGIDQAAEYYLNT